MFLAGAATAIAVSAGAYAWQRRNYSLMVNQKERNLVSLICQCETCDTYDQDRFISGIKMLLEDNRESKWFDLHDFMEREFLILMCKDKLSHNRCSSLIKVIMILHDHGVYVKENHENWLYEVCIYFQECQNDWRRSFIRFHHIITENGIKYIAFILFLTETSIDNSQKEKAFDILRECNVLPNVISEYEKIVNLKRGLQIKRAI